VLGTVRSSDGAPVSQASVTVGSEGDLAYHRTLSGTDGTFHLEGLPPAEFELAVRHEKLGKAAMKLRGTPGETLPCDVRLSLGLVLRGRLLTESGEAVAKGRVSASAEAGNGEARWQGGAGADAEGRFVIGNCPDGRLLSITAEGEGIVGLQQNRIDPRAGELLLYAKKAKPLLPPSARIIGTFLRADGKPAANLRISVNRSLSATDENGHFEFGPVVPGTARVSVSLDDLPQFRSQRELAADAIWDLGTVRLAGGTVSVRLDGKAEIARLLLCDQQGVPLADIDPRTPPFRSHLVCPGSYRLLVSGPEIAAMALPVEVRENEEAVVDVRPQRGVARKIAFTAPGGWQNDVVRLDVRIASGSDLLLQAIVTNVKDEPVLPCRLVPGSYTVTATRMSTSPSSASRSEGLSGRSEFTVAEGTTDATVRVIVQ